MRRIQSKKYKLGTYEINKRSLSCFDDKRFVLNDGIHTLAHFHKGFKKTDSCIYYILSQIKTDSKRFLQIIKVSHK